METPFLYARRQLGDRYHIVWNDNRSRTCCGDNLVTFTASGMVFADFPLLSETPSDDAPVCKRCLYSRHFRDNQP